MGKRTRIRNRIIIIVFLCLIMIIFAYAVAMNKGKGILIKYLEGYFGKKTSISSLNIIPPLRLEINKIEVQDIFKSRQVIISPSIMGMLLGRVAFNGIVLIDPSFILRRNSEGKIDLPINKENLPDFANGIEQIDPKAQAKSDFIKDRVKRRLIIIGQLKIKNGTFTFIDSKISDAGHKITADNIEVDISKLSFSALSNASRFLVKANLPGPCVVDFQGWINFFKKDMEGKLKIDNLDLSIFTPYYRFATRSDVKSGFISLEADFKAKNNNLVITSKSKVKDFLFKAVSEDDSLASDPNPFLFSLLDTNYERLQNITIYGKLLPLVPFQLEKVDFNIFTPENKAEKLFAFGPLELVEGKSGSVEKAENTANISTLNVSGQYNSEENSAVEKVLNIQQ